MFTPGDSTATTKVYARTPKGAHSGKTNFADDRLTRGQVILTMPLIFALLATTWSPENAVQSMSSEMRGESSYRTVLFGVIYAFALAGVLLHMNKLPAILRGSLVYAIFLIYVLASATWSDFPYKVLVTWGHFAGIFLVALAAVIAFQRNHKAFVKLIVLYAALTVLASIVTAIWFPARGIMEVGGKLRWVGITATPNTLGLTALLLVWASMALMSYACNVRHRAVLLLLIATSAACLYMADSIAAAILSILCVVLIPLLVHISGKTKLQVISILSLTFVTSVAAVFFVYLAAPELFQLERILATVGRDRSLTGRTGLWEIANSAIREKPVLGWGFDALMSLGSKYRINYGQFHNGYLDLLVRGGWVGMLLVGGLVVQLWGRIARIRRRNPKAYAAYTTLLVIILLHNLTEASLGRSPHIAWLLVTFSYFYVARISEPARGPRNAR